MLTATGSVHVFSRNTHARCSALGPHTCPTSTGLAPAAVQLRGWEGDGGSRAWGERQGVALRQAVGRETERHVHVVRHRATTQSLSVAPAARHNTGLPVSGAAPPESKIRVQREPDASASTLQLGTLAEGQGPYELRATAQLPPRYSLLVLQENGGGGGCRGMSFVVGRPGAGQGRSVCSS